MAPAPINHLVLSVDLSELSLSERQRIDQVCRSETAAAIVRAKARQRRIASEARANPPRAIEGLGGQTMVMDPVVMAALRRLYKPQAGDDHEFWHWVKRKWPEYFHSRHEPIRTYFGPATHLRRPEPIGRLVVGYGSTTPQRNVRYSKTYESDRLHQPTPALPASG